MPLYVIDSDNLNEPMLQAGSKGACPEGVTVQVWFNDDGKHESGIAVDVHDGKSGEVTDVGVIPLDELVDADLTKKIRELVDGEYIHKSDIMDYLADTPPEPKYNQGVD